MVFISNIFFCLLSFWGLSLSCSVLSTLNSISVKASLIHKYSFSFPENYSSKLDGNNSLTHIYPIIKNIICCWLTNSKYCSYLNLYLATRTYFYKSYYMFYKSSFLSFYLILFIELLWHFQFSFLCWACQILPHIETFYIFLYL